MSVSYEDRYYSSYYAVSNPRIDASLTEVLEFLKVSTGHWVQDAMITSPANSQQRHSRPEWFPRAILLPSILSFLAHAILLLIFALLFGSCHRSPVRFSREELREVGIVVKQTRQSSENSSAVVTEEARDGETMDSDVDEINANDLLTRSYSTPDQPPVETLLPRYDSTSKSGPGVNLPTGAAVLDPRQPVKSRGGQRPAASGALGGPTGTVFMGTQDQALRVIFVIDASGSMISHNSMQIAKTSLVSSLQSLNDSQQFLMIFYDDKPSVLNLKDINQPQLYAATEINKTLARQKIAGIQPGSGTQHVPALEMALRLQPDVIFFLTDAQEPPIYDVELESLKKLNNVKTRIHSIEFGVGKEIPESAAPRNFLRKLSRQNGGTYRYYDVTKFK